GPGANTPPPPPPNVFSVTPTADPFLNVIVGTASQPQTTTVTNGTLAGVTINSIAVSGTNAVDFTTPLGSTCGTLPATLAASGICTFQTTFTPSIIGNESATLTVTYGG